MWRIGLAPEGKKEGFLISQAGNFIWNVFPVRNMAFDFLPMAAARIYRERQK